MTKDIGQAIGPASRNDFYVYTWTRTDTGDVFYVGKGRGNRDKSLSRRNQFFRNILSKLCGLGLSPIIERVRDGLTEDEAFLAEKSLIEAHGRRDINGGTLVNLTDGGDGRSGAIVSANTREKTSSSLRAALSCDEARKAWSAAQHKRYEDPEQREKTSIGLRRRYEDPAEREKTSAALRGVPKSEGHVNSVKQALLVSWADEERKQKQRMMALRQGPKATSTSGYKGVSFDKSKGKWLAQIEVEGRNKHLGRHDSAEDAARAYDAGAILHYGLEVYLNFNDNGTNQSSKEIFTAVA